MNRAHATIRSLGAAIHVPRLLAVLALTVALVAIPAFRPEDASARRTSYQAAASACNFLGGDFISSPIDDAVPDAVGMFCVLPWAWGATAFTCGPIPGAFAGIVGCNY